jgi:peptidoglycan hydrolase CwlO-like protein
MTREDKTTWFNRIIISIAGIVISGSIIGLVNLRGDVVVHTEQIGQHERRITESEKDQRKTQNDISEIKQDLREIKTILLKGKP